MFIDNDIGQFCTTMLGTCATVVVALRLGYTAKAGVENYKKISGAMQPEETTGNDDQDEDSQG